MDEHVTKLDAVIVLKYISGIISEEEFAEKYAANAADVNEDGVINAEDVEKFCTNVVDVNHDGVIDIIDVNRILKAI